jgi:hypothetical protein
MLSYIEWEKINNYQPALSVQTSAGYHGLPVYPLPSFRPPQIPQIPTFTLFDAYSPTSTKPDRYRHVCENISQIFRMITEMK